SAANHPHPVGSDRGGGRGGAHPPPIHPSQLTRRSHRPHLAAGGNPVRRETVTTTTKKDEYVYLVGETPAALATVAKSGGVWTLEFTPSRAGESVGRPQWVDSSA